MHIPFIDFTQAFDCVNLEPLFPILKKHDCPTKFIRIIKKLYSDMHARMIIDGELSKRIEYNCHVKQGYKLAPIQFEIYAVFYSF